MNPRLSRFSGEVGLGLLIVSVLGLIVLPVPLLLIDVLLAVNLAASALLLFTVMYVPGVVALSTFPTLLLFTTIFRLSLNIASTKAILLEADAGHVIEAFGNLVVGGNVVVGLVIFIIITIVQFIVIAKGSERVAEVGARFTLDAMPGKQMSIDADLRAGQITGEQARARRDLLAMESSLHGGMDGAMKFVKGDAIAGLVITVINIVGGIAIGAMYHGMTVGEAAARFTVLSIGDAMVSQIPSLLISVAAGILVTRVADEQRLGNVSVGIEIGRQLTSNPRPLILAALLVFGFAMVPAFPKLPFLVLAAVFAWLARQAIRRSAVERGNTIEGSAPMPALKREGGRADSPTFQSKVREFAGPMDILVAPQALRRLNAAELDAAMARERDALQEDLGLPFPGVDVVSGPALEEDSYCIRIHDVPMATDRLPPDALWVVAAPNSETPGADGQWLEAGQARSAQGQQVLSPEQRVARHAVAMMRRHAHLFIGIQEMQWILERISRDYPNLVAEVLKASTVLKIAEVVRRLLEEQVSVRNIRAILESIVVWAPKEKDALMLTEYVRGDLGRYLAHRAAAGGQLVQAIVLDASVEQSIRQAIKQTPAGNFVALPPDAVNRITDGVLRLADGRPRGGMAVVTSMDVRRYVRKMVEKRAPWLDVYSFQELGGHVELRPLGRVEV